MIKQVLSLFVLLIVVSTIRSEPNPKNMFTFQCQKMSEDIKKGTLEGKMKEREECREQALPKDIYAATVKCNDLLPMKTADQVTKVCADIDGNVAKFEEVKKCIDQALGKENIGKYMECCKKMTGDDQKPSQ